MLIEDLFVKSEEFKKEYFVENKDSDPLKSVLEKTKDLYPTIVKDYLKKVDQIPSKIKKKSDSIYNSIIILLDILKTMYKRIYIITEVEENYKKELKFFIESYKLSDGKIQLEKKRELLK